MIIDTSSLFKSSMKTIKRHTEEAWTKCFKNICVKIKNMKNYREKKRKAIVIAVLLTVIANSLFLYIGYWITTNKYPLPVTIALTIAIIVAIIIVNFQIRLSFKDDLNQIERYDGRNF